MPNATAADAELLLKLYDLRREAEMRKARNWWLVDFWPETAEDVFKIGSALGTQENNWMRQVGGYWEMAASLVKHGALSEDLFLEPSFSGEMFFYYAKLKPFLPELREKFQSPTMMSNIEALIMKTEAGRNRLHFTEERIAMRLKAIREAKASKQAAA